MSSAPITLRAATRADEPTLVEMARRLIAFELPAWRRPEEISTADAREMMDAVIAGTSDNEVLIAERDGKAVGCLHMLMTIDFFGRPHAHISVIATSEAAEGTGVGRLLIERAEEWSRARGMSLLTLNVFDANARARRFYERAGFTPETLKYVKEL
jgi:GNAT superfamily N-acetyltransferase